MSNTILVTGATGFVGSHLVDSLLERKPNSKIWATRRYHLSNQRHSKHFESKINWVDCNLTDPVATSLMIEQVQPDIIYHCAAESFVSPSWAHPIQYMSVNYNGTVNLLESVRKVKKECLIHIPGSGEEYGEVPEVKLPINNDTILNPVNPYAVTKIAQDLIAQVYFYSYGVKVIRTRAFNHEGPRRENVFGISSYAYQIAKIEAGIQEPVIETGDIDDKRNFTDVRDMVIAYQLAVERCNPGELYLVGTNLDSHIYTFRQVLEKLIALSVRDNIKYRQVEKFTRPTKVPFLIADTSKFENQTGWRPSYSIDRMLIDILDYWRYRVGQDL